MVFSYNLKGQLTFVRGVPIAAGGAVGVLPCWDAVTPNGHFLYTGDTANDTLGAVDLSNPTSPKVIQIFKLAAAGNPFNVRVDPVTGRRLFNISQGTPQGTPNLLHVLTIRPTGLLAESVDPVAVPVNPGTNAYGLLLVPQRGRR
jgi:hypothetical protein